MYIKENMEKGKKDFFFVIEIGMKIMSDDIIHSSQVLKCVQDSICVEFVYHMKHVVFI